jgi:hypothetical protein
MRDKIAFNIILIIIYFFPQDILADPNDTLISNIQKYNLYQEQNYQEKIYVRLDKNYYLAGEFLRFNVFCLDAKTLYFSQLSKVAYLELLDTNRTSVIQTKILLHDGKGYGEVFIPSNFESGNYLLRGYTRWMRNYKAELYHQSVVPVINPFKNPGLKPKPKTDEIDVQFFVEGGSLVNGINSRIAFRAINTFGKDIDFSGSIIDDQGNEVLEFSPVNYGTGSFYFTPDRQKSYRVVVFFKDSTVINPSLPEIKNEGYVMSIDNSNPDNINVKITSNHSSRTGQVFLVGQTGAKIQFTEEININNGSGMTSINKANMDPGIMKLTIFNSLGQPVNRRMVFIYPEKNIDLHIDTEKKVFQNREKVIVKVSTSDENDNPIGMDLSISVLSHHKYFDNYNHTIKEQLLLSGVLKRNIEDPDYFLEETSEEARQAMDNLMLIHTGNESLWDEMNISGSKNAFIPEYRYHIISGTLTNKKSQIPVEGIVTYLSVPSKNSRFHVTKSQHDGKLYFEMNDFTGRNEIIAQTNNTIDSIYQITLDNPFSEEYSDFSIPFFDIDDSMQQVIEKASRNMQIQNAYIKYRPLSLINSKEDTSTFYYPFTRYFLDDYTRFPVMEEVMREYIVGVYVRRNRDGYHFRILDEERNETYQENPLILLDGCPVFDANEIMVLDPLRIEKIETVRKRFLKGVINSSGIVSLSTYEGDLGGFKFNENALIQEYDGIQPLRTYSTPEYDITTEENSRMPDFRNVLYWNPQFKTDGEGEAVLEFYTSDDKGVYEIRIEGLSSDGRPASGHSFIQVSDNRD